MDQLRGRVAALAKSARRAGEYERSSRRTHHVAAAAAALGRALEEPREFRDEAAALRRAVERAGEEAGEAMRETGGVVADALDALEQRTPARGGVETLARLQERWEAKVARAGKEAAHVPAERVGAGAWLYGRVAAAASMMPSPAMLGEEERGAIPTLARATGFVKRGDLEEAVKQLDTLEGHVKFVVQDWLEAARARLVADRAMGVIQMQCAMMNHNMGTASETDATK
mmetsp:Transcript_34432/g.79618  ORF Transcript_34432/g.79618 Transcript_34432/m.79618 type:complete len:229 (-) Transcript_34432:113-799(-)